MKPKSIILLILICLQGCSSDLDVLSIDDKGFKSLTGKKVEIEILGIPRIQMVNDKLLFINHKDNKLFTVFDLEKKIKLIEYGKLDEFPEQYSFPIFESKDVIESDEGFSIHDPNKNMVVKYRIKGDSLKIEEIEKLPNISNLYPKSIVFQNDSLLIFMPENGGLFVIYDKILDKTKISNYAPVPAFNIEESQKWIAYQSKFGVNSNKGLIAVNSLLFGELNIYNFEGLLLKRSPYDISNHTSNEMSLENLTKSNLKRFALDLDVSDSSIYILIEGNTFSNIRNKRIIPNSKILEFDWNGNFKGGFLLDRPIISIAFDKKHKKIYGVSIEDENEILLEYDAGR